MSEQLVPPPAPAGTERAARRQRWAKEHLARVLADIIVSPTGQERAMRAVDSYLAAVVSSSPATPEGERR